MRSVSGWPVDVDALARLGNVLAFRLHIPGHAVFLRLGAYAKCSCGRWCIVAAIPLSGVAAGCCGLPGLALPARPRSLFVILTLASPNSSMYIVIDEAALAQGRF